ncbi:hypothetical protein ACQ4PT_009380 [Festuca glaucescens]
MASSSTKSRRWSDMVEEEEAASSEASSRHSYSDVVKDGSPSPARSASPEFQRGVGESAAHPPPVRPRAPVAPRPAARAAGGGPSRGAGGRRGPQPKRQRRRAPLPSLSVPEGVPAGLASLCFNCTEPGHVAGVCLGKRKCLLCKSEDHVARQCPTANAPVAGAIAHGAPPPPRGAPPSLPRGGPVPPAPRAPPVPPVTGLRVPPAPPAAPQAPHRAGQGPVDAPPPYRVPARQRLGLRDGAPPSAPPLAEAARPPVKERLGVRGAGREEAPPQQGPGPLVGDEESPYERGLRRERELRAASPLRQEERARGEGMYARCLRREQESCGWPSGSDGDAADRRRACGLGGGTSCSGALHHYRSEAVDEAERALRWGLVAFVSGTRRSVSSAAVSAEIVDSFPAQEGHFSVHRFWPADFLIVFDSRAFRDSLLASNPLDGRDFSLRFGVWNRQLQATRQGVSVPCSLGGGGSSACVVEHGHGQDYSWLVGVGGAAGHRHCQPCGYGELPHHRLDRRPSLTSLDQAAMARGAAALR